LTYTIHPNVRAALFDIDGTLTTGGEIWDVLIKSPAVSSVQRARLYAVAMPHYFVSKTGIVSQAGFRDKWVRHMARLMKNWPMAQAQALYEEIVRDRLLPILRSDVVDVLQQHKTSGHPVILVSTMFDGIVGYFAGQIGADAGLGSRVEFNNGFCAGRIAGPTCSGPRKLEFARQYLEQHHPGLSLADCSAYADSRSDVPFLAGVGYPAATYPDEGMRDAAQERGWPIFDGK
jgi:HAD superfamily hydrolase (TIGR01490 family)